MSNRKAKSTSKQVLVRRGDCRLAHHPLPGRGLEPSPQLNLKARGAAVHDDDLVGWAGLRGQRVQQAMDAVFFVFNGGYHGDF
jgi:hypothetical protein